MRRRSAFFVSVVLAALAGCAGVLGLEDRHLDTATASDGGGDEIVGDEATPLDAPGIMDAAVDVLPDSPCASSVSVYDFDTVVGGRGYVIDPNDAPSTKTQRAFGLIDPRFPLMYSASTLFHALRNDAGDYLVSYRDAESGYTPFEDLANIGNDTEAGTPPPPVRSIVRYVNDAGTAHRFARDGEPTDGWQSDNHVWWVCP